MTITTSATARKYGSFLFACLVSLCLGHGLHSAEKPNIIVIMADDLGYGDVSCNGAMSIQTPGIDRLAREGIRFTSGYCSASTCTPTRFSFLTGTYAFRQKGTGVAPPNGPAIIKPETETLPALLKRAGYATAVVGKWHLGLGDPAPNWNGELKPGPLDIGFDHAYLLPTTNDRVPQVIVEDRRVRNLDPTDPLWVGDKIPAPDHPTGLSHRASLKLDWSHGHNQTIHNGISRIGFYTGGQQARFRDEDLADMWVKESVRWIEQNQQQPFFLFFAAHDIHVPRIAHERFQGKSSLGPRGDCILEFDWCVSEITQTLERLKLADKTLIVICSDNGPVLDDGYKDDAVEKLGTHQPAGPFRGGKYSVWEGGTRIPFIVRWTGRVAPSVSDEVVSTIDLPASLAALAGQSIRAGGCPDSQNVMPALLGEKDAQGRQWLLQQDNGSGSFGLRVGKWKLVRYKQRGASQAVVSQDKKPLPKQLHSLYDLAADPGETQDVSAENPELLQKLIDQLESITASSNAQR